MQKVLFHIGRQKRRVKEDTSSWMVKLTPYTGLTHFANVSPLMIFLQRIQGGVESARALPCRPAAAVGFPLPAKSVYALRLFWRKLDRQRMASRLAGAKSGRSKQKISLEVLSLCLSDGCVRG